MEEEIGLRRRSNLSRARSFQQLLEETLQRYHNRLIDAAAVVEAMLKIRQQMEADDQRAAELGLDG